MPRPWVWSCETTPPQGKMGLCTFISVFIPSVLIGGSTSYLLLRLWSTPASYHDNGEREVWPDGSQEGVFTQKSEKRHVLYHDSEHGCNSSFSGPRPVGKGQYQLLVLVDSSPGEVARRRGIRETWLQDNHRQQRFIGMFVVGLGGLTPHDLSLLTCEDRVHGDLLLLSSLTDTNTASSRKLLQSFIWAKENIKFRYILKCTDSTFVRLDLLLDELAKRGEGGGGGGGGDGDYIWGFFAGGVQATKDGHLGEKNWYMCTHYLPYPEGGGYVISEGLVSILCALSDDLEHYAHGDLALGVWLSPFNEIERKHDVRFNTGYYSRGCNNAYLVTYRETVQSMAEKFVSVRDTKKLCQKEVSAKPSYYYNWTVPSNRCCVRKVGIP